MHLVRDEIYVYSVNRYITYNHHQRKAGRHG